MSDHILAHRHGPHLVLSILGLMGASCPVCGYGTRATSKRWARCKRKGCDGRARRRSQEDVTKILHHVNRGGVVIRAGIMVGKPAGDGPTHVFRPVHDTTLCGSRWAPGWLSRETKDDAFQMPGEDGPFCQRCVLSLRAGPRRRSHR